MVTQRQAECLQNARGQARLDLMPRLASKRLRQNQNIITDYSSSSSSTTHVTLESKLHTELFHLSSCAEGGREVIIMAGLPLKERFSKVSADRFD